MCSNDCPRHDRVHRPNQIWPDLSMPAMPPLALIASIRAALDRRACRRHLQALLTVDDRQLADWGYQRHRVRRALRRAGRDNPCRWLIRGESGCDRRV